jgi:hypothetical protein
MHAIPLLMSILWATFGFLTSALAETARAKIEPAAAVNAVCAKPEDFDHQIAIVQGTVTSLEKHRSRLGNDYTTFKLQECSAINIFTRGHPTMRNGDHVRVEGVFETERHKGPYTFYNDIEAI